MPRDRLTKARRSWNMSRIRGKHTAPEKAVRSLLHRLGYRFRLHVRIPIYLTSVQGSKFKVQGSKFRIPSPVVRSVCPDILLPKHKTAIFVHGCFLPSIGSAKEGGTGIAAARIAPRRASAANGGSQN